MIPQPTCTIQKSRLWKQNRLGFARLGFWKRAFRVVFTLVIYFFLEERETAKMLPPNNPTQ